MSKAMENYLNKRKTIVNSAKVLFLGKGYTATSMDKVAEKAGITKQTIYRYFPSKTDLFRATLEAIAGGAKKKYAFGDRDIQTELYEFGRVFLEFHMKRERLNVIRLIVAEGRKDKALSRTFFETREKISGFGTITPFLRERVSKIDDTEFLAGLLIDMLLGIRMPVLLGAKDIPSEAEIVSHVKKVVEFFLVGCKFATPGADK